MHILLSICIPTFNRAKFLNETLQNITNQLEQHVEIIIVDGASSDNTFDVVGEWVKKYNSIKYFQEFENGGVDVDLAKAVTYASGKYCMLMSSDDFLQADAIKWILSKLRKFDSNTAILLCSRVDCNKNMIEIRDQFWLKNKVKHYSLNHLDNSFIDYINQATSIGAIFSYISCIVVSRDAWNNVVSPEIFFGTNYAHVYRLLSLLKFGYKLEYTNKKLVLCRMDNDSFSSKGLLNRYLIDFYGYIKIIDYIFPDSNDIKLSLYRLIRKEHGFCRILKIRIHCTTKEQWNEFVRILLKLKYNRSLIIFIGYSYVFKKFFNLIFTVRKKIKLP